MNEQIDKVIKTEPREEYTISLSGYNKLDSRDKLSLINTLRKKINATFRVLPPGKKDLHQDVVSLTSNGHLMARSDDMGLGGTTDETILKEMDNYVEYFNDEIDEEIWLSKKEELAKAISS